MLRTNTLEFLSCIVLIKEYLYVPNKTLCYVLQHLSLEMFLNKVKVKSSIQGEIVSQLVLLVLPSPGGVRRLHT